MLRKDFVVVSLLVTKRPHDRSRLGPLKMLYHFGGYAVKLILLTIQTANRALWNSSRITVSLLWMLAACMLPCNRDVGVAYAQNTNATIRGQVLDPIGALVPEAQVVIVNKNTNVTVFTGRSDSAGAFVAPQVIPGTYKLTVNIAWSQRRGC